MIIVLYAYAQGTALSSSI
uniref:Uncharacterized protein n=1 Tax=Arundo donax TaxID=35708 RepID=A0A0A9FUW8_ARUDO